MHHHHHVPEGLGVLSLPRSLRSRWSLYPFLGRFMFLLPFFYIVIIVLIGSLCPLSVRVEAPFSGTVLFPLLCAVLPFFA